MKIHRVLWAAHVYNALYGGTHSCGSMAIQSRPIVITQNPSSIYRYFVNDAHKTFPIHIAEQRKVKKKTSISEINS